MSAVLQQLKSAYETNEMSLDEISSEFPDFSIEAIKAALMQCSSKYRKDCGEEDDSEDGLNFSSEQLRNVNREIYQLAMSAEDEHLRGKMLVYIRDDKKGRKEIVRSMAGMGNTFNILQFNEQIQQARGVVNVIKRKLIEA